METIIIDATCVKKLLRQGVCEIIYQKKDGSLRLAKGTTNKEYLKENTTYDEDHVSKFDDPENLIRYYDVEKDGWRTFYVESLQEVPVLLTVN